MAIADEVEIAEAIQLGLEDTLDGRHDRFCRHLPLTAIQKPWTIVPLNARTI